MADPEALVLIAGEVVAAGEVVLAEDTVTANTILHVLLEASPANRIVAAWGYVNGVKMCAATAADMALNGAISSPFQSFTLYVPPGARFRITGNGPTGITAHRVFL
jgi:hypothetical protein